MSVPRRWVAVLMMLWGGCGYVHDEANSFFPADWTESYEEIVRCSTSQHPRGGYVRVVMNPEAKRAWCQGNELPEGTVVVKEQWDDHPAFPPGQWDLFTVMKREAGKWQWQTIGGDGGLAGPSGDVPGCVNCHASSCNGELLCSKPPEPEDEDPPVCP